MKKFILVILVLVTFSHKADSQAYSIGDVDVNIGVSFLYNDYRPSSLWYWNDYNYSFVPPLTLSLEKGVSEYFSLGAYGAYRSYSWDYTTSLGFYENKYTRMSFGGRASLHMIEVLNNLLELGIEEEDLDIYLTGIVGFNTYKRSITEPDERRTNTDVNFFVGPVLGGRYYFTDKFGIYLEGGRGSLGYATGGITLKF